MAAFDLIAFDLDGTVFGIPFKQEITQRVYRAFQAAHDRGITIAVATGRPVAMLGDQLKSAPWLDWGITVNGAQIVDMQGDQPSLCRPIDKQLALKLMRELGDKVSWSTFIDDTPYVEEKKVLHMADMGLGAFSDPDVTSAAADAGDADGGESKSVMERFGFNPIEAFASRSDMTIVPSIYKLVEELPKTSKVQKFGCAFDSAEDTDAAFSELTRVHKDLDIAILNATELEVTGVGVNKGSALELLCWKLGIDPARAVAFGDSGNDISLTGRSNHFVAMGNADGFIKERADEITATVQEDGVAAWIEKNLLN